MNLPRDLQEWAELLAVFPRDLAMALGGLVRRLDASIGPYGAAAGAGGDDLDGYSGLASRGSYERLLPAEWALASEMPDEFVRRAAMREHVFYQRAFRTRRADAFSVALFDAGPTQLGAPRLAHMALLIVLARRAEAAKARFFWGTLQNVSDGLREGVHSEHFRMLLDRRTIDAADRDCLERWQEGLDVLQGRVDLWIVSHPGMCPEPLCANRIEIEESPDLAARGLVATIAPKGQRQPNLVELPLPASGVCVRLIRHTFEEQVVPGRKTPSPRGIAALQFSPDGRKITFMNHSGEVCAVGIPASTEQPIGRIRRTSPPSGQTIVAWQPIRRSVMTLTRAPDGQLYLNHPSLLGGRVALEIDKDEPCSYPAFVDPRETRHATNRLCYLMRAANNLAILHDCHSRLYVASINPVRRGVPAKLRLREREAGNMTVIQGEVHYTVTDGIGAIHPWTLSSRALSPPKSIGIAEAGASGILLRCWDPTRNAIVTAAHTHAERWAVRDGTGIGYWNAVAAEVAKPLGLMCTPDGYRICWLARDRRDICIGRGRPEETVLSSTSAIVEAVFHSWRRLVAFVTAGGDVVVFDVVKRRKLLEMCRPAAAEDSDEQPL